MNNDENYNEKIKRLNNGVIHFEKKNPWDNVNCLKECAKTTDVCVLTIYKISSEASHEKLYCLKIPQKAIYVLNIMSLLETEQ